MMNPFIIKKNAALIMGQLITTILFFVGLTFYGLIGGLGFMAVGVVLFTLLGNVMLRNPFTQMLEGKGLLTFNIDSKGIINPLILGLDSPYLRGANKKKMIEDIFDRDCVMQLSPPKTVGKMYDHTLKSGKKIKYFLVDEEKYNDARFSLFQYPVLIYNEQIDSLLTKSFLKDKEDGLTIHHGLMYIAKKVQDMGMHITNFARHVVNQATMPKTPFLKTPLGIIVIIVGVLIIILAFGPMVLEMFAGSAASIGGAAKTITPTP